MPTEVVVDQKRSELAPVDPDAKIPDAVKRRSAAVDAFYAAQPPATPEPAASTPPLAEAPVPQVAESLSPAEPTPPAVPSPAEPVQETAPAEAGDWEHRYLAMKGRYDATQRTLGEMQEQMAQMGDELLRVQQATPRPRHQPPSPPQAYLTEQDVQNYGTDLVSFATRAAQHAVTPQLQELEQRNRALETRLAREARQRLDERVEIAIPNYREIDTNPRWLQWLRLPDIYSGRIRQELLNEAISAANAPRVISFFRGFLAEEQATGSLEPALGSQPPAVPREPVIPLASLAAPGRARPAGGDSTSMPLDKPTYTRTQIAGLYSAHRKGAYAGREAEWQRQEADIFAAQREGRVRQ